MKVRSCLLIILTVFLMTACIDEFLPETDKYESLVVVDGILSSDPGPYTVKISLTSSLDLPRFIPYEGCTVLILDNEGNTENLTEYEPGIYMTAADGIQGIIGREYMIRIITPNGETYVSPFQKLIAPVGIDSVYSAVEYRETSDLGHVRAGLQFYVDTYRAEQDTSYFLWQLGETFKFNSDFYLDYLYIGYFQAFTNKDSVYTCWTTQPVYEFFTAQTLNLSDPVLTRFPLHYVDTETRRLSVRYSLLVHQYSVDKEAFSFFDQIRNLMIKEGALYAKQPYQVTGNILNQDDPGEPVLGYFLVAGVDSRRIFVDRPVGVPFYYPVCELVTDLRSLFEMSWRYWPIYVSTDRDGNLGYASDPCFDCTLNNGTLEKPDFWE